MNDCRVSIWQNIHCDYPSSDSLFRPSTNYPEYIFSEVDANNSVYEGVRESLHILGMDEARFGTKDWNPLGELVHPGDTVLIKPNLVMHENGYHLGNTCMYTHPSLVAAMIDYVLIALQGSGKIVVADAPMQECDFEKLISESGYSRLIQFYKDKGIDIALVDLRELKSVVQNGLWLQTIHQGASGTLINLGKDSEFDNTKECQLEELRITNYDPRELKKHHTKDVHEYYISDLVLSANVIINMPKPKCHRKAGVTISLKNMVGTNIRKEYLPHHTNGSVIEGGDEYCQPNKLHALRTRLLDKKNMCVAEGKLRKAKQYHLLIKAISIPLKLQRTKYREGSWYGNHTISKTVVDINKIIRYATSEGQMETTKQREMFICADMIVSGEKEGPVCPTPKKCGVIACGYNSVLFDEAIATIMGFDYEKIPTIVNAKQTEKRYKLVYPENHPQVNSNREEWNGMLDQISPCDTLGFIPSSGWRGHIEL